jgi:hypothetical protein
VDNFIWRGFLVGKKKRWVEINATIIDEAEEEVRNG